MATKEPRVEPQNHLKMEIEEGVPFHLVVIHGFVDTLSARSQTVNFWRTRFPHACAITDFPFFDDDVELSLNHAGLVQRAQCLLATANKDRMPFETKHTCLPIVFLCHDLGGYLLQQALVLASKHQDYRRLANETAVIVICNGYTGGRDVASFQHQIEKLVESTPNKLLPLSNLFEVLSIVLTDIHWKFLGMAKNFSVVRVNRKQDADVLEIDVELTLHSCTQFHLDSPKLAGNLWEFGSGDKATEKLYDLMKQAVRKMTQDDSKDMRLLLHMLSAIDVCDHLVNLSPPHQNFLEWLHEHRAYLEWRTSEYTVPDILYFCGSVSSENSVTAC
ncbi:hypothetical protein K491DRAFT_776045 [Lophiostoma macrostomum CBS 122681]|uniref:DUF676 domain-containing protein n=1 Tax=Lophiostoma macrostomum CBS 122681 TaxID=1314788 RepID=A0A6A6TGC1_9PLEO|nr:hypothetical protein K491DRAFT_776045 [Lophiostoma macrostomum CBS 122681]